jgi:hypothetical protein
MARRSKIIAGAAVAATLGVAALAGLAGSGAPVSADPQNFNAFQVFGSDTLKGVTNAFAGFEGGINFTPLQVGLNNRQLVSWDAAPDNQCISTKPGAPTFHRPNGSTEGRYFLSVADGGSVGGSTQYQSTPCGNVNASGLIDVARSSSWTSGTSGALTYAPGGRDAITWAYYAKPGVTPVSSLTLAQIQELFTDGEVTVGSTRIIPCGIQVGSGTFQFWNQFVQQTFTTAGQVNPTEAAATLECRNIPTSTDVDDASADFNGRLQESDATPLKDKGDGAPANTQVVVGFSSANFIASMNGVEADPPITIGVNMGTISTAPYSGALGYTTVAAPPPDADGLLYQPNAALYGTNAGRVVGYVLPTGVITGPGEFELKDMFTNTGPAGAARMCAADALATWRLFGFQNVADCGSIVNKSGYTTTSASFSVPLG